MRRRAGLNCNWYETAAFCGGARNIGNVDVNKDACFAFAKQAIMKTPEDTDIEDMAERHYSISASGTSLTFTSLEARLAFPMIWLLARFAVLAPAIPMALAPAAPTLPPIALASADLGGGPLLGRLRKAVQTGTPLPSL
jgi:hypothetical protein